MTFRRQLQLDIQPLILLLFSMVSISYALLDPEILLKFKSSLTNHTALKSWENSSNPICNGERSNWIGVVCQKGAVLGLKLENMGLSGTIDANTLVALSSLRTLNFMNNNFNGSIPEFNKLTGLRTIFLSYNRFSGDIPGNAFKGMVRLNKLYLSKNRYTGPIPASLATLPRLSDLKLDGNRFSGEIPDFKQEKLHVVDLSNNQLEGPIPASLSKMNADMFAGNKGVCGAPLKACEATVTIIFPTSTTPADPRENVSPNFMNKISMWIIVIPIVVGVFILLAIVAFVIINQRKKPLPNPKLKAIKVEDRASAASSNETKPTEAAPKLTFVRDDDGDKFDLQDLLNGSAEILGSGCFGSSYRTSLPDGTAMVVKRYKQMNGVGKEDFQEHMRRIGRLRHNNVLTLVAYYYRKDEKLFVCDFVQNCSLAVHLHAHQTLGQPGLDWPTRLKIVKGVAKGLAYLHKELPSLIAPHGHLKSSNVLLNESFEPLLTDYALIPVINAESAHELMVAYKSPEYVQHGRVTKKTDVWSLGVLILEIMTGKFPSNFFLKGKGNDEEDIVTWVKSKLGDDDRETLLTNLEVFDREMGAIGVSDGKMMKQLLKIGLSCCEDDVQKRIDLKEAAGRIEGLKLRNMSNDGEFFSAIASDCEEDMKW
ncbi:pollen receptor like kinase 1 [Hibiscus trionum]|uniref:Pollen receptor like kinase 1 n=1 Tax=Hibiscus trionum TaxID=183268 RepID=A0A9W7LJG7_HIBTR|nr:pollen receptor like kinase 1 [Hibiscus trionum]